MARRRSFGTVFRRRYRGEDGELREYPGWTVRYRVGGRVVQRGGFRTEREASGWLSRVESGLSVGVSSVGRATFAGFWPVFEKRISRRRKGSTAAMDRMRWEGVFRPYWGDRVMSSVTREDVEEWLGLRARGGVGRRAVGKATLNRDLSFLSVFFQAAVDAGEVSSNVVLGIKRSRERVLSVPYLSVEDVNRLEVCAGSLGSLVRFLFETGMRLGEVRALRWSDVDENRRVSVVRDSKSGESREVPWTRGAEGALMSRKLERGSEDVVFPVLRDLSKEQLRRRFKAAARSAELGDLRIHDLRHGLATALVRAGVPLPDVQRILGHKTLATTMRYACHQPHDASRRAMELFDEDRGVVGKVVVEQPRDRESDPTVDG